MGPHALAIALGKTRDMTRGDLEEAEKHADPSEKDVEPIKFQVESSSAVPFYTLVDEEEDAKQSE